jgi:hypothetical protein
MGKWKQSSVLTMIGGIMLIVGALLPWANLTSGFGTVSIAGTEGDGVFALGLGAIIALAGFGAFNGSATARTAAALIGIVAVLLMFTEFSNVSRGVKTATGDYTRASVGIGLWVAILGALLSVAAPLAAGSAPAAAVAGTPPAGPGDKMDSETPSAQG